MTASFYKHVLKFIRPGGTSRGVLTTKDTYILEIADGDKKGTGECAVFRGLSYDDRPDYEEKLAQLCRNIYAGRTDILSEFAHYPSIIFGYEQALLNLKHGGTLYFPGSFTDGKKSIRINGLIWMGTADFMRQQIFEKLNSGFNCLKLKIGTDWNSEREIIKELRKTFSAEVLELRVDANGGFTFNEVPSVLRELSELKVHSIEQPIKAGNTDQMAELCSTPPLPVALDEELIGVVTAEEKFALLNKIKPQYIILKPALTGGFSGADEWISIAEELQIGWWITSALESNIGLNAIAQYTAQKNTVLPQGLGTGALFSNNFPSALELRGEQLRYKTG